jgi:hypothetical protein
MLCPSCHSRKAKRACPALGQQICAVCCGTKRLVEISCPSDCVYLAAARTYPPAVVVRQQERDRSVLLPMLQGLTDRQGRLFLMLAAVTAKHEGEALQQPVDEDIAQAAGALASTLETSARGIVYEHQPASLPAARLLGDLKTLVGEVTKNAGSAIERDAAIALRRIEDAAKQAAAADPNGRALQQLLSRVLTPPPGATPDQTEEPPAPPSSLIIP